MAIFTSDRQHYCIREATSQAHQRVRDAANPLEKVLVYKLSSRFREIPLI